MVRKLRMLVSTGLLLPELLYQGPNLRAQEATVISGDPAVRFEQSPGFFHYVATCRTPTEFMAQMPPPKMPREATESAVCWYVKTSRSRAASGANDASPLADGKFVISAHHFRFLPHNPEFANLYTDIDPQHLELKRETGQPYASLGSKEFVFNFRFSKLCPSCAPGTPVAQGFNSALLDQEFSLLDESLRHFDSGWKRIYYLSAGTPTESTPRAQPTAVAASTGAHPAPEHKSATTPKASVPAVSNSGSPHSSKPDVPTASHPASKPAAAVASNSGTLAASRPVASPSSNPHASPAPAPSASAAPKTASAIPVKPIAPPATEPKRQGANKLKVPAAAADAMLVKKVAPVYPLEAKVFRLEGTVLLRAIIDKTGEVSEVNALSGPPLLETAAVDAVKQWQYRPYSVNGQTVDFETTIQVVFALDGSQSANHAQKHP